MSAGCSGIESIPKSDIYDSDSDFDSDSSKKRNHKTSSFCQMASSEVGRNFLATKHGMEFPF